MRKIDLITIVMAALLMIIGLSIKWQGQERLLGFMAGFGACLFILVFAGSFLYKKMGKIINASNQG